MCLFWKLNLFMEARPYRVTALVSWQRHSRHIHHLLGLDSKVMKTKVPVSRMIFRRNSNSKKSSVSNLVQSFIQWLLQNFARHTRAMLPRNGQNFYDLMTRSLAAAKWTFQECMTRSIVYFAHSFARHIFLNIKQQLVKSVRKVFQDMRGASKIGQQTPTDWS